MLGATEPDTLPANASTLQRPVPRRFDWQVNLRDNTYNYERLVETGGSVEHAGGRNTSFKTTATLNLQPIRLLTRWSEELLGGRGGIDRGRPATREDTLYLGPADSPLSHNSVRDRAVTQPKGDTASSVYDSGGERVPDTPQNVNDGKPKTYYMIQVNKLKLCTAATQSQDCVAAVHNF